MILTVVTLMVTRDHEPSCGLGSFQALSLNPSLELSKVGTMTIPASPGSDGKASA